MQSRSLCLTTAALVLLSVTQYSSGVPVRVLRQAEDNCNHPFHSFLCHKAPRARVQAASSVIDTVKLKPPQPKYPQEESLLDPTFIIPKQKTTPAPVRPEPSLSGDSSIGDPVFVRPTQPPTTPSPYVAQAAVANEARVKPQEPDLCAHSFHSFLCQPGKTNRRRIYTGKLLLPTSINNSVQKAVPVKTTKAPPPPPPEPNLEVPESSLLSPSYYYKPQPVVTTTTPKPPPVFTQARYTPPPFTPTKPRPTLPPPQPETPDASADSPSFLRPDPVRTTPPPALKVFTAAPQTIVTVRAPAEHYKGQNACDHAFHSYLCQPAKSRRRNYGRLPEQAAASFQQNYVAKLATTTTARPVEVPEYSELLAVAITTKRPLTTVTRLQTTTQPPTTRPPVTQPPTTRPPPTRPPTTRAPATIRITTTRRPLPTTTEAPIEPAPSSAIFSGALPPRPLQPAANTVNSRVQLVQPDLCKHAFHSFLCQPARPRKIQFQPRPAQTVIEESLLLPAYRTTARPTPPPTTRPPPPPTTTRPPPPPTTTRPPPPPTTRRPLVTRPPPPRTTTEREQNVEVPESSFQDPQRILPPQPNPAATVQNTIAVQHAHHIDLCNHPFHAFLCHKTNGRARRPIRIK